MTGKRGAWVVVVIGMLLELLVAGGAFGGLFLVARRATEQEWRFKLRRHSPEEMRGMLDSLASFRSEPANFLPHSMLDDEACAALVSNALNFIIGEERFKPYPAWLFYRENASVLEPVYDRSADFAIQGNRVVETFDRPFRLRKILDPHGIYVLGYHYRFTRSDEKIIRAGSGLNSHVMLLLNNVDGHWWGYHLIHRPGQEMENPVKVERIDQMPTELDLVYIWKVKGISLPDKGKNLFLLNKSFPYSSMAKWLSHGGPFEYYVDTVVAWIFNKIHGKEQFPRVIDLKEQDIVEVATENVSHGDILALYKGVPIYFQSGKKFVRGEFGMKFECVEFVNRFLASIGHRNLQKMGDADSYFWHADKKGLRAFPNNGLEKPQKNDLLVFDNSDTDKNPGHVAVVSSVTDPFICFVQQNVGTQWKQCLRMTNVDGRWAVINTLKSIPLPVAGWVRR